MPVENGGYSRSGFITRFCDDCGSVLTAKRVKDKGLVLVCACGATYQPENRKDVVITDAYDNKGNKTVVLVDGEGGKKPGATIKTCPKCGNDHAYFVEIPPMWGDEESVHKYRCTKCGHVFNEGGAGLGW